MGKQITYFTHFMEKAIHALLSDCSFHKMGKVTHILNLFKGGAYSRLVLIQGFMVCACAKIPHILRPQQFLHFSQRFPHLRLQCGESSQRLFPLHCSVLSFVCFYQCDSYSFFSFLNQGSWCWVVGTCQPWEQSPFRSRLTE